MGLDQKTAQEIEEFKTQFVCPPPYKSSYFNNRIGIFYCNSILFSLTGRSCTEARNFNTTQTNSKYDLSVSL